MEEMIKKFVKIELKRDKSYNSGDSYGSGWGNGNGSGHGYSDGKCYGNGSGVGYGNDAGFGWGYNGCWLDMDDLGSGYGYDINSNGIKSFNKEKVYYIDGISTIIKNVRNNIAQGFILHRDFTLTPCFIAKEGNTFAHGDTIHEAYEALQEKLFDNTPIEIRIQKFKEYFQDFSKKYPAKDLFQWHHILTGSCKAGRIAFCQDNNININIDEFTIYEFIKLTENSYNGYIIKKLI